MGSASGGLTPGRLWSLWDMLRFYADQFISTLNWLQTLEMTFSSQIQEQLATDKVVEMFCHDLEGLNEHLDKMDCRLSMKMSIRAQEMMKVTKKFDNNIQQVLKELRTRIVDELGDRMLFSINSENAKLLDDDGEPLFGPRVAAKLPSTAEDIAEAGHCLALNRPTACVFHLMRVMETGVQVFGNELGVELTEEKNWHNILDEVNKAIKAKDQKDHITKLYAGISSNLYNVKLAWRNEVMHPKQTYTPDEAKKVFSAVDSFTRDLVAVL
ncbi:MAG: hypothetical protein ACRD3W_20550 [Terriglobales bacterium]